MLFELYENEQARLAAASAAAPASAQARNRSRIVMRSPFDCSPICDRAGGAGWHVRDAAVSRRAQSLRTAYASRRPVQRDRQPAAAIAAGAKIGAPSGGDGPQRVDQQPQRADPAQHERRCEARLGARDHAVQREQARDLVERRRVAARHRPGRCRRRAVAAARREATEPRDGERERQAREGGRRALEQQRPERHEEHAEAEGRIEQQAGPRAERRPDRRRRGAAASPRARAPLRGRARRRSEAGCAGRARRV